MNHLTHCRSFAFVIALVATLAGCGGGGSGSSGASALSLSGVAATGQPIANGAVSAKCSVGSGSTTTAANGSWTMSIAGGVAPCVIEITVGATKLHSYAMASGVVNVTQLTEEILRLALGGGTPTPAAFFANPTFASLTAAQLQSAEAAVRADLANRGIDISALPGTASVLTLSFAANGTGVDHILDLAGPAYTVQSLQLSLAVSGAGTVVSSPVGISCSGGSCPGTFPVNQVVTLTATPTLGNTVSSWGGDCAATGTLGATGTCVLTMNASKSVTTTFTGVTPSTAALSVTASGLGAVTSSTGGIVACSANTCSETDPLGTAVTLTATATAGNTIAAWGGDCAGIGTLGTTGTCALTLTAARNATVSFTPLYSLTASVTGSGTVTSSVGGINCPGTCTTGVTLASGTAVTLTATSSSGFQITSWGGDCAGIGTLGATGTCAVPAMNPNRTASVTFTALVTLTVSTAGPGASAVTSSPAGINCGNGNVACSAQFPSGTPVTLTESNPVTETFTNWTLGTGNATGCSGTSTTTCAFTLAATTSVRANFAAAPVGQLNVSVAGGGTVASTGGITDVNCTNAGGGAGVCVGLFTTGTAVNLTATPGGGYTFAGWRTNTVSGGGNAVGATCTGTTSPCAFNKVAAAQYLTAVFSPVAAAPLPLFLYTDLLSGPTTGGEANNGIYLSVFGKNFGSTGVGTTVKVYIDNIEVAAYKPTVSTALPGIGASRGRTDIQQISTQVGAIGGAANGTRLPVKIIADGRESNANGSCSGGNPELCFMPNPGRILFVALTGNDATAVAGDITKPYRNVQVSNSASGTAQAQSAWGNVQAGDFMVMRAGTWSDSGISTYFIRFQPQISANQRGLPPTGASNTGPIGLIGYPGEAVQINKPWDPANFGGAISGANTANQALGNGAWVAVSNLAVECGREDGVITPQAGSFNSTNGGNWRVTNNDISALGALTNLPGGPGVAGGALGGGIDGDGLGHVYLGNFIHDINDGADNPNLPKQNHGIYISDTGSYEVAYNRFERIRGGNAIQTFANGTAATGFVDNVNIHHNIISDVGKHGINISDGSRNGIKIWNNVIFNIDQSGIKFNTTNLSGAKIYNNTVFNVSRTAGFTCFFNVLDNGATLTGTSLDIRNNIFVAGNACRDYTGGGVGFGGAFGTATNNLWFNGAASSEIGSGNVLTNPNFVSTGAGTEDFHVNGGSPAIDVGTSAVSATVVDDFDLATGAATRTLRPIGAGFDIGAYER